MLLAKLSGAAHSYRKDVKNISYALARGKDPIYVRMVQIGGRQQTYTKTLLFDRSTKADSQ